MCGREFTLDLFEERGFLGAKPTDTPIGQNLDNSMESGELLNDIKSNQRLDGCLLYLNITPPSISYAVSVISQLMHAPRT